MLILIISLLCVALSGAEVILAGQCNTSIPVETNFNLNRFSGRWRLISTYPNPRQSGTCNQATYEETSTGFNMINSHVVDQALLTASGTISLATTDGSAKFIVNVGTNLVDYWILGTDYDSYALAYTCENLSGNQQRIYSWKLGRTTSLSTQANNEINNIIDSVSVLDNSNFEDANHTDAACFYYPDLGSNDPVIFPGQCDNNINVVNNFNMSRFEGRWILISTYYSERQSGTCNRAEYTQIGNTISVVNSHVVDQSLLTVDGTATLDGSGGKLIVNVGTNPPVNYWILDTDYESYALTYSCENINSDQRRIWSWKLSRTTSLSAEASQSINNTMNNVDVLDERYFQNANQSDEACFYFPEIGANEPVIFPGQCETVVNAAYNFSMSGFAGQWILISSYYSERQSGTCNRAQYTEGPYTIDVVHSHVTDQTLATVSGTALYNVTGKLVILIGTDTFSDYWIIDTDYYNYALAYSCENLNSEQRRVWSWKLSRTTYLSTQSTLSINSAMNRLDVIDERYFQNANQSEEGCFYYPEFKPNEPVIFPGQCDPNIPVVSNFNMSRYEGEWILISSYYAERQSGTCNRVEYTQRGNIIDVVNSHVLNQTLTTVSGTATVTGTDGKLVMNVGTYPPADFWILDTDYDTYSLAYKCENINDSQRRVYSWKLSRTTSLSNEAIENMDRVMSNIDVVDNRYFQDSDQSDEACFYLPDIPLGQEVIFPGQCNPNISVVQNFNLDAFLGNWRLISSYYSHRQSGTCNQISYENDGTTIRVRNMHVVNLEMTGVSGTMQEASIDGSGKFTVSISRRTVDYWILATDYNNYALAYTCVNLDSNRKRIYSWKLSRSSSLSNNANNAINRVVDTVDVLNERYYESTNQTDAGCFHFPEVNPSAPVIFPGTCDFTTTGIRNFNMTSFIGRWHVIEMYPIGSYNDQCATQEYTQFSRLIITMADQHVRDEIRHEDDWLLIHSAIDGSAGFLATIRTGDTTSAFPFWVLATDYNNYALIYSCNNAGSESRQVYSWKLSRRKELNIIDNIVITAAMNDVIVLDQRYYNAVNHSEEACFHFPEPDASNHVVMPGQCDENIPVVRGFDVERYTGTWYQIERYPQRFESGRCTGTSYTLDNDVIRVRNWQEVNGALDIIEGTATVISADGSAKLRVNLQRPTETEARIMDLYVLATDYDSYSLAYSCVNVDSYYRSIGAWKLSRNRTMSVAGNTAINAYIADRPELDQRYFLTTEQSEDCPSSAGLFKSSIAVLFVMCVALFNL